MAPTTAKLKHDIDRGRGGDKVDVFDPAAAPLGTDDEAAGTPPSPAAIKQAHDMEIRSMPVSSERADDDHAVAIYIGLVMGIAGAVGLAIWLTG
jgi:hypothetical protein